MASLSKCTKILMYIFLAILAVKGIKAIKPIIIAINEGTKSSPMNTFEIINTATPMATVKA